MLDVEEAERFIALPSEFIDSDDRRQINCEICRKIQPSVFNFRFKSHLKLADQAPIETEASNHWARIR